MHNAIKDAIQAGPEPYCLILCDADDMDYMHQLAQDPRVADTDKHLIFLDAKLWQKPQTTTHLFSFFKADNAYNRFDILVLMNQGVISLMDGKRYKSLLEHNFKLYGMSTHWTEKFEHIFAEPVLIALYQAAIKHDVPQFEAIQESHPDFLRKTHDLLSFEDPENFKKDVDRLNEERQLQFLKAYTKVLSDKNIANSLCFIRLDEAAVNSISLSAFLDELNMRFPKVHIIGHGTPNALGYKGPVQSN